MADLLPVCACGAPASTYLGDGWKCARHREAVVLTLRSARPDDVRRDDRDTAGAPIWGKPCPAEA